MSTRLDSSLFSILKIRLLVGFLGERAQFAWWPTEFYESSGRLFLEPIFAKALHVSQYHGVVEAGRRHHDEHLNAGSYHLFRLPEEIEQDLHILVQKQDGASLLNLICHDSQFALDALLELAGAANKTGIGPVAIGHISDLVEHLRDLASVYSAAFKSNAQSIPYLVR